jgi:predicted nucleotidyltransferase
MTPVERRALDSYVAAVRKHYGKHLVDILLFGSRARGDAGPNSDVDLAVILEDGEWQFWREKWFLSGLAYDAMVEPGLWIEAWPLSRSKWNERDPLKIPLFVASARRDAKPVSEAA